MLVTAIGRIVGLGGVMVPVGGGMPRDRKGYAGTGKRGRDGRQLGERNELGGPDRGVA